MQPSGGRDRGAAKQPDRRPNIVWLVLWVLVCIGASFLPLMFPSRLTSIPYSTFYAAVEANNVVRVLITGDQIDGTLRSPQPIPVTGAGASNAPAAFTEFTTIFPQVAGDVRLLPLLQAHGVTIEVARPNTNWLLGFLLTWGPVCLLLGGLVWLNSRRTGGLGSQLGFGKIRALRYDGDRPKVSFDDVAGAADAKSELQEEVDFLRHPDKYHALGATLPKGVLLVGAPGTGKTLLARAVAGEAGVPFLSLNASEFVEMFVGVGASRVRDLFAQAKEIAPAIVFIDELDAVGRRRGAGLGQINDEREQTLNQLLGELDGFDPRSNIIVLAATNRADVLDPALLRPGRFDRQIAVPLPDRAGRESILRIHVRKLKLSPDVDPLTIAAATIGMSGADLANLCNEAALASARRGHLQVEPADFDEALDRLRLGAAHPQFLDDQERRIVAHHEAGHATVAWFLPGADPVHKVTILPRGQALGMTEQLPAVERHNFARAYLQARIAVMLAGRTAEEIAFDEITTGAENDLVEATKAARQMVTRWGMSDIGLAAFEVEADQPFLGYEISQGRGYSEATAARIDAAVSQILAAEQGRARALLTEHRERFERLAQALLANETVGLETLTAALGPRRTTSEIRADAARAAVPQTAVRALRNS